MGDWKFANLLSAASKLATSEMWREKKQQNIGSTSHQSSRKAWPRICNSLKHFIFVFSTQVSYFNLTLKLSFKLSDLMFFSRKLSIMNLPTVIRYVQKKGPQNIKLEKMRAVDSRRQVDSRPLCLLPYVVAL